MAGYLLSSLDPPMTSAPYTVLDQPMAGVVRLSLARPDSLNALSSEMMQDLLARLQHIARDPHCRVLVLAAQGKAFSAGHDLREMRGQPELTFYQDLFAQCSRLMLAIQKLPQPVIAQIQGIATAAGCAIKRWPRRQGMMRARFGHFLS